MLKKEILCFGDSNTHGYRAEDGGRYPYDVRWTGVMAGLLGEGCHIIEEGLSGRTSVFDDPVHEGMSGLAVVRPIMMTHEPIDTMIIMLGTNDTKERFGSGAPIIGIGIQRLAEKALSVPAWNGGRRDLILVSPAPISPGYYAKECGEAMGRGCSEKSFGIAAQIKAVAAQLGCRFLDAAPIAEIDANDDMHLSRKGHAALAAALADMLK